MEGADRQHEVRPAVGCAAGCAGTSDLFSRCGWLLWRVEWVCCFKSASHYLVLSWLWPLSYPRLFGPTWGAVAPVLVPCASVLSFHGVSLLGFWVMWGLTPMFSIGE